jgi:hypothetical protein
MQPLTKHLYTFSQLNTEFHCSRFAILFFL